MVNSWRVFASFKRRSYWGGPFPGNFRFGFPSWAQFRSLHVSLTSPIKQLKDKTPLHFYRQLPSPPPSSFRFNMFRSLRLATTVNPSNVWLPFNCSFVRYFVPSFVSFRLGVGFFFLFGIVLCFSVLHWGQQRSKAQVAGRFRRTAIAIVTYGADWVSGLSV